MLASSACVFRFIFAMENLRQHEEDVFQILDICESRLPDVIVIFFVEEVIVVEGFLHSADDNNKKNDDTEYLAPLLSLHFTLTWSSHQGLQPSRDPTDGDSVELKE